MLLLPLISLILELVVAPEHSTQYDWKPHRLFHDWRSRYTKLRQNHLGGYMIPATVYIREKGYAIDAIFKIDNGRETLTELFLVEPTNVDETENTPIDQGLKVFVASDGVSFTVFSNGSLVKAILPVSPLRALYELKSFEQLKSNFYSATASRKGTFDNLNLARQKRSNKKLAINIDILAIVDWSVLKFFTKLDVDMYGGSPNKRRILLAIRKWYAHLISGANKMYYNSLKNDPDLSVNLNLLKVIVMKQEADAPWSDGDKIGITLDDDEAPVGSGPDEARTAIDATRVLNEFRKSMLRLKANIPYDHAIGFTRKLLTLKTQCCKKETRSTTSSYTQEGIAYHSLRGYGLLKGKILLGICRGYGFSVISDRMSVRSQFVIAHEIGHNLGLSHDGEQKRVDSECEAHNNHLMTPVLNMLPNVKVEVRRNAYKLSACSIRELKSMLFNKNRTVVADAFCLLNKASGVDLEPPELPGQVYSAHWQCKMWGGITASLCINMSHDICTAMSCRRTRKDDHCVFLSSGAMDASPCDKSRWCEMGVCVPNRKAPQKCLWGDAVQDCYRMKQWSNITHNPSVLCQESHVRNMCCDTCKEFFNKTNEEPSQNEKLRADTNSADDKSSDCPPKFNRVANMCLATFRTPRNYTSANQICKDSKSSAKVLFFDKYKEFKNAEDYLKIMRKSTNKPYIWLNSKSQINFRNLGSIEQTIDMCTGISVERFSIEKIPCSDKNMVICRA